MIAVVCLGFWLFGVAVGMWAAWMWRELKDEDPAAVEHARVMGRADAMSNVLDPKGPVWNRMHADGWDEGYRAGQAAAAGTYGDGSEAPTNPYRAAVVAARGAEGGGGE